MAYVKPEDRDTSYYLFHELYRCQIPFIQTMSADYIKHFGMPTCFDAEADRAAANELITTMLTINDMVEYFKRGTTVRVVNYADTAKIYERIADHLNAWKHVLETRMNSRNAPIEDLIDLDKFANVVYVHAKHLFTEEIVESILFRQMGSRMRMSADRFIPRRVKEEEKKSDQVEVVETRQGMADIFAAYRTFTFRHPGSNS